MAQQQGTNPARMYQRYFVPGIFSRWTPLLLEHAGPVEGERVLDLACGTGVVARHVAPLVGEDGRVVGLDNNPNMLEVARSLPEPPGAPVEFREGDAAALPDGPFDLVLCQQGLQFFSEREESVKEMSRVLAPGGRAALSVWKGLDHQPVYEALCEAEARYLGISVERVAAPPFSLGDADELRDLLDEASFESVDIAPVSHTVRFPEPERFVTLTTLASAAVLPEFAEMDEATRTDLVEAVSREMEGTLRNYAEGDEVAFPMHAHVAVGRS